MSAILGFKGSKEELRRKLQDAVYNMNSNYVNKDSNGWPDIKMYVDNAIREFNRVMVDELIDSLYTQQEFEKDIGLAKE